MAKDKYQKKKHLLLVVDDDMRMLKMLQRMLSSAGYLVAIAENGIKALDYFTTATPDLVLLDIMMPVMDGYEVCTRIREFSQVPIIMVTAVAGDREKIASLDAGADDYVTKPFSIDELEARIRAVLRRTSPPAAPSEPVYRHKNLEIDLSHKTVRLNGKEIELSATEYKIMAFLVRHSGNLVSTESILVDIWGENNAGNNHLLQVNMGRIRIKLKDNARKPIYITTRPGMGYKLARSE